jgi:CobQ-like glutamine amidotransferase family enzyme
MADDHMAAARREFQHGAVLPNDHVEAGEIASDSAQVHKLSSGHEDHDNALLAGGGYCVADRRLKRTVNRDCPVVVECERCQFHGDPYQNRD